jgi:hypothetical protein
LKFKNKWGESHKTDFFNHRLKKEGTRMSNTTTVLDEVILVEGAGLKEVVEVSVKSGAQYQEIIVAVAQLGKFSPEKAHIFSENEATPLNPEHHLAAKHPRHQILHVHPQKEIEVKVSFNGQEHKMHFSPATTVNKVLAWATHEIYMSIHGDSDPLSGTAHIGRFVAHDKHKLELDVITPAKENK